MATTDTAPAGPLRSIGWSDVTFRAMGTHVHLAVLADDPSLLVEARRRIEDLEGRWSRFRADSTLSQLNRAAGRPVSVDAETFDLVVTAVAAWHGTDHRFDPTVLDALEGAGYDRSFDQIGAGPGPAPGPAPLPAPGCAGIRLDPELLRIQLPAGLRLDLGGIGKGRAADLVATELLRAGARSAMANLGGDLRIAGALPPGGAFSIVIEDPCDVARTATVVDLGDGALATSSTARRRWTVDGAERHHLIDPRTGAPSTSDLAAVTVIAPDATTAETLAKAALVAGSRAASALLVRAGTPALVITRSGTRHRVNGFEDHER